MRSTRECSTVRDVRPIASQLHVHAHAYAGQDGTVPALAAEIPNRHRVVVACNNIRTLLWGNGKRVRYSVIVDIDVEVDEDSGVRAV